MSHCTEESPHTADLPRALGTGLFRTVAGRTMRRQLAAESDGLRAFLAGRSECLTETQLLFAELETWLERCSSQELREGPSFSAVAYRAARDVFRGYRADNAPGSDRVSVPWEPPRPDCAPGYGRLLDALRAELGDESEILDLRWARGLGMGELAFVLRCSVTEAEERLARALAWAGYVQGSHRCEVDLGQALHDAFQMMPDAVVALRAVQRSRPIKLGVGTVVDQRYRIEEFVGGGQSGYVYRASDVRVPGHMVALKMLHNPARTSVTKEGAIRELTRIASVTHPSLVQLKDHGWWQDRLWFTMPWYEGETLEARMQRGPLSVDEATAVAGQIGRALAALHKAGLVHQDVKPANILLAEIGCGKFHETVPVLLDLGVASSDDNIVVAGTPLYFSPELATAVTDPEATVAITGKSDVFALALTVLHAVLPGTRENVADEDVDAFIAKRALTSVRVPFSWRLRKARGDLALALNADPAVRPTAATFAQDLAALSDVAAPKRLGALSAVALAAAIVGSVWVGGTLAARHHRIRMEQFDARAQLEATQALLDQQRARAEALERELEAARRPHLAER
ncbi:MAG: serine/threonine protein kinase [Myxococcales bacterium]|nr:serine/threonine protein kinase [Myxococcales bacterium]